MTYSLERQFTFDICTAMISEPMQAQSSNMINISEIAFSAVTLCTVPLCSARFLSVVRPKPKRKKKQINKIRGSIDVHCFMDFDIPFAQTKTAYRAPG